MTWSTEQRSLIRSILTTILTLSISCYCLGGMVLLGSQAVRPPLTTPTLTQSSPTSRLLPSITWVYMTLTASMTPSTTVTLTPSGTFTPFSTPTVTQTQTSSVTPIPSSTFTPSLTHTLTASPVPPTDTPSPLPTNTRTPSPVLTDSTSPTTPVVSTP